eukprot:Skav225032  [mRNA]  locus=scaffold2061:181893:185708:+ [translate_table: standard]
MPFASNAECAPSCPRWQRAREDPDDAPGTEPRTHRDELQKPPDKQAFEDAFEKNRQALLVDPLEPLWHRSQRNRRRRLRGQLRKLVVGPLGHRGFRKLQILAAELSLHHSWNLRELPALAQQHLSKMWWCSVCQVQNSTEAEYCHSCQQHWNVVWKKRRSRSHGKKDKKEKGKPAKDKQEVPSTPQDNVRKDATASMFLDNLPWIVSTPQAHLPHREVQLSAPMSETGLPPPPVLPEPPAMPIKQASENSMTAEEQQALIHLKGLMTLGLGLPPEMESKLQLLQAKEKELAAEKSLTHSHLHKLSRLKNQITSAEQKIVKLDGEWKEFVATINKKLQHHGMCYQHHRADLLEVYNKKVAELIQLKQDMSQASQALIEQANPNTMHIQPPDVNADFQRLQEALAAAGAVDQVQQISDDGMDEEEMLPAEPHHVEGESAHIKPARSSTYRELRPAPFGKAAGSPKQVTQHHLKRNQPPTKETGSRKEEKEGKEEELL